LSVDERAFDPMLVFAAGDDAETHLALQFCKKSGLLFSPEAVNAINILNHFTVEVGPVHKKVCSACTGGLSNVKGK
jgi:hypothetical protein